MIYWTTDSHFSHKNLIKGQSKWEGLDKCRDFATIEAHDAHLLKRINSVARPEDTLIHLGDFANCHKNKYENYRASINCKNVILVYGNHDKEIRKSKYLQSLFISCHDILNMKIDDIYIVMCHYPMWVWEKAHYGSWMLHGHSHNSLEKSCRRILDVAPEGHNFTPWSFQEIKSYMEDKIYIPKDHHKEKNESRQSSISY